MDKAHEHEHPYVRTDGTRYLVKIHNALYVGSFSRQWYGLCLHHGFGTLQFDAPGYNSSQWMGIWEVME